MKENSFKYLPIAYDPETTRLANNMPSWHPIKTKRMSSDGHKLLNSTAGLGLSDIRYKYSEAIDNTFLGTCRTDQLGPVYVKTISYKSNRDSSNSRNILYNAAFEWTPSVSKIAWKWYTCTEKISDQSSVTNTVERDTSSYFYGGNSLKTSVEQGYQSYVIQSIDQDFPANKTIGISLMYKGENTLSSNDGIMMYLTGEKVSTGETISTSVIYGEANTENTYIRMGGEVEFSNDVTNVNFVIKIYNSSSDTIEYNVDCAQMEIGGRSSFHIRYDDPVWFIETENIGPYDVFYSDSTKRRVIYCDTSEDFIARSVPTRVILSPLSRNISLQTMTKTHSSKVEFDGRSWPTEFKIENNKVVRFNSEIPEETFATYDLYELNDNDTQSINTSATLHDLGVIGELLYVFAEEDNQYVMKVCNPAMNEPEGSYLYVINTLPIEDDYEFLQGTISEIILVQATDRNNLIAIDITYSEDDNEETIRFGLSLKFDYYIFNENSMQIITRENYNSYGGIIVT